MARVLSPKGRAGKFAAWPGRHPEVRAERTSTPHPRSVRDRVRAERTSTPHPEVRAQRASKDDDFRLHPSRAALRPPQDAETSSEACAARAAIVTSRRRKSWSRDSRWSPSLTRVSSTSSSGAVPQARAHGARARRGRACLAGCGPVDRGRADLADQVLPPLLDQSPGDGIGVAIKRRLVVDAFAARVPLSPPRSSHSI